MPLADGPDSTADETEPLNHGVDPATGSFRIAPANENHTSHLSARTRGLAVLHGSHDRQIDPTLDERACPKLDGGQWQ